MINIDEAKDELQEILNGKEYLIYQDQPSNLFSIWWDKAKKWLAEQLEKLFPSLETTSAIAGPLIIIIVIVILTLIGLAIYLFIRKNKRKRMFSERAPLYSQKEIDWSYQMHIAEALVQEELALYAPATRHLFLALLLYFHEKDWLEARVWKTNWEYYEELKKNNQQRADQFYHLADFFDKAAYGEHEVQQQEYRQFQTEVMKSLGATDE